jgi:hypothetical protein
MDASALVVGIDGYANIPQLIGSAQDASEVADLLLSLGMSASRLYLHAAPASGQTLAPPAGLTVKPATRDEIWSSILAIRKERGDRLYVFLSGHGYYLAETGPIFLTQDWSTDFPAKNLDITSFAGFFRSLPFRDQLFVVDACQNYATDPIYRTPIPASRPDIPNWTPQPANGLILCCGATQGQYAVVAQGRGLLTRNLLAALKAAVAGNLPIVARDAIEYDWRTGARRLDLKPLFDFVISPAVVKAASGEHASQTPTIQAQGRAMGEPAWTVLDFAAVRTAPVTIEAAPGKGVDTVRLELRPPARDLNLPLPDAAPSFPFLAVAPLGSRLIANCTPTTGWVPKPEWVDVTVPQAGIQLNFVLTPPANGGPSNLNEFNLKLVTQQGVDAFQLRPSDYAAAGVNLGEDVPEGTPRIVPHQDGPDIQLNGAPLEVARTLAEQLRESLTAQVGARRSNLEIFVSPPGKTIEQSRPNLRLDLPQGGTAALVGFLGSEPLIRLERVGGDPTRPAEILSADRLTKQSLVRVDTGIYRVHVDTPWGAGVTVVEVGNYGVATCTLPEVIGREPLRNAVVRGEVALSLGGAEPIEMPAVPEPANAFGFASKPDDVKITSHPGVTILFRREGETARAEPYSDLPWVEWDMLIGAGRLDAVDLTMAARRVAAHANARDRADRNVLLIALAYAACAQRRLDFVEGFLEGLSPMFVGTSDALLLRLDLRDDQTLARLDWPLFRWGADLVPRRSPRTELPGRPSPGSTWSVFQVVAKTAPVEPIGCARTTGAVD